MLNFTDISSHQSASYIPPGDGVVIKLTQGEGYFSSNAPSQIKVAREKGVLVGFYHFAEYDSSADKNADAFLRALDKYWQPGDNIVLDHEAEPPHQYVPTPTEGSKWGLSWLERVRNATTQVPWVYSNISWAIGGYCAGMGDYPWWGAAPSLAKGTLTKRGPFKQIVAHQYDISSSDRDVFYGTRQDWIDLAKRGNSPGKEDMAVYAGPAPTRLKEMHSQPCIKGSYVFGFWFDSPNRLTFRIAAHSKAGHGDIKYDLVVGGPASKTDSWPAKPTWKADKDDIDAFSIQLVKIEGPDVDKNKDWTPDMPDVNGNVVRPGWDASHPA